MLRNKISNKNMGLLPKKKGKAYVEVNGLLDLFTDLNFTYELCWIESSLNL